ncbi:hypothetical protein ABE10_00225, partial [Bacillus toyonensis]|nr:hypothetical protein [Bacillus toyonensis]
RLAQRQDDPQEDAELPRAIDPRRLEELVREPLDELAHEEDGLGVGERRQDEAPVGVHAAEVGHQDERRDEGDVERH